MITVIGEILVDRFADYERIGGAPFNFAYHLKRLGLPVQFISRVGNDSYGKKIQLFLEKQGFPCNDIQVDNRHPTGMVDISLDAQGIPQFTICLDTAYDYIELDSTKNRSRPAIDLVYFGSLAQRTSRGFAQIRGFLQRISPSAIRFCDINLRPPHVNAAAIAASLKQTDILKLNTDEVARVSAICSGPNTFDDAVAWLRTHFAIETVAVTRGDQGSVIYTTGRTTVSPPVHANAIVDTVGAGDAYAAVLAAGRLKNLPLSVTLELATRFAADVCQLAGAIPEDDALYMNLDAQINRTPHGQ
jgi:fructokinase